MVRRITRGRAPNEAQILAVADQVIAGDWRSEAACATADPEAFYPDDENRSRAAKTVCAGCPVVAQCLAYAFTANEPFGVWGGLGTDERDFVRTALMSSAQGEMNVLGDAA